MFLKVVKNAETNNNNTVLRAQGGRESSNPATRTTHSGMGEKETHNYMLWENEKNQTNKAKQK